jgi:hypothetical protein
MAGRNFLQGDCRCSAFFLCVFAAWREWTTLGSALRDQAENPGSCKVSPLSCGALEWIFATPGYKDVSVRKKSAADPLSTIRPAYMTSTRSQNRHDARSCVRCKRWRHEWARVRISSVDILPPGFGDANVATEHNQSNRRD